MLNARDDVFATDRGGLQQLAAVGRFCLGEVCAHDLPAAFRRIGETPQDRREQQADGRNAQREYGLGSPLEWQRIYWLTGSSA